MTVFNVTGMTCGHCTKAVEEAILGADEGADVTCDLAAGTVEVESDLEDAALIEVIGKAGYVASPA
ncbi:heavy-metal-associated domain-containing protein [Rhodalgimonas zhirmunskyi]|uniref:Heavy-metal-associated domain-containing protein n=1 Tax=Rhodalgimonas zhirmunskyi TaxID=2964767 RepID=A0AAJ1X754_9RHOB|nr:heavy-metal-associated domain-containing protein [Rhodoalgimonas zhirmunskyi]MDQ2095899.1 heavy-metal-associated domain-containing protein [Rhodoalgimonas zhirmunskyi]